VAVGWGLLSEEALRHPVALTRCTRKMMEEARKLWKLHRLEIWVDADHFRADDWARRGLGMDYEGYNRMAGPNGEDRITYARVWE